jgi:flagellar hook assembly protein FlgD
VIYDIKLDQTTGELFIITDKGLVSYRTTATYEDPEYASTTVFPNPVRPTYFGPVTIQGIRYNSDVKITDVAGNLVYKTVSNGGTATWDCKNLNGERVATGVYLIWTGMNEGKGKKVGKVLVVN